MILCIGTTPAAQRVMIFRRLALDQVNRAVTTLDGAAGKSINVAKVLHALGANPLAVGFLGGTRGQEIQELLRARGVESEFVQVSSATRQCVTVIDQDSNTVTELVEESRPVSPEDYARLLAIIERRIGQCDAVVLSGTVARGGPADFYLRCLRRANQEGVLCITDAAGPSLLELLTDRPGLVKPNRAELEATLGRRLREENSIIEAMQELHRLGAQRVIVTNGAAAAVAFDGNAFLRIHSIKVETVNPIGSGDAFTAALVWQLASGAEFSEACRWAAAAGAANALTPMAGEVEVEEMKRLHRQAAIEAL